MIILREIFLELGKIFHFEYDKNPNGSYRVNTIIKNLVYPDLYLSKEFSSNDICYYLANPEYSYQGYPNIRNSFSELMNPKETGNRYPIINFCELIDIKKMNDYYKQLINDIVYTNKENKDELSSFLDNIFDKYPTFHARLKMTCTNTHEFITWIVIFAMFNSELANSKYDQYLQTTFSEIQKPVISESGERHKLSTELLSMKHKLDLLTNLIFILSTIQIFFAFLPFVMPDEHKYTALLSGSTFFIALLFLSLVILFLRRKHAPLAHSYANFQTYHEFMDEIPDEEIQAQLKKNDKNIENTPFNDTSNMNVARIKLRSYLMIFLHIMLGISVIISIIFDSFPLLLVFVFLSILTFLYADRTFSDYFTRCNYDRLTCGNQKPNPWRALAKIYKWEYERTGFNMKDDYYKTIVHVHSGTCYKHIFLLAHERLKHNLTVCTIVLIYFSTVFTVLESLTIIMGDSLTNYLHISNTENLRIITTIYLVVLGVYTITTLITSRTTYGYLAQLSYASRHAEKYPQWAEKLFLSFYARGIIRDIEWVRGIYTHNVAIFEKGTTVEEIFPESDRMQFYHRHIALRPVMLITISLLYSIFSVLFVWHLGIKQLFLPITIFFVLLYIFLYYKGLIYLNKKRIIEEIKKL